MGHAADTIDTRHTVEPYYGFVLIVTADRLAPEFHHASEEVTQAQRTVTQDV
jgi:hypothetical protein